MSSQQTHPPQIHPLNPQNPSKNTAAQTKKAANMEKLKEAVMKLLNNQPNTPLSDTHKAHLIEERVSQVLSLLHSPDHPPYAWVIIYTFLFNDHFG